MLFGFGALLLLFSFFWLAFCDWLNLLSDVIGVRVVDYLENVYAKLLHGFWIRSLDVETEDILSATWADEGPRFVDMLDHYIDFILKALRLSQTVLFPGCFEAGSVFNNALGHLRRALFV